MADHSSYNKLETFVETVSPREFKENSFIDGQEIGQDKVKEDMLSQQNQEEIQSMKLSLKKEILKEVYDCIEIPELDFQKQQISEGRNDDAKSSNKQELQENRNDPQNECLKCARLEEPGQNEAKELFESAIECSEVVHIIDSEECVQSSEYQGADADKAQELFESAVECSEVVNAINDTEEYMKQCSAAESCENKTQKNLNNDIGCCQISDLESAESNQNNNQTEFNQDTLSAFSDKVKNDGIMYVKDRRVNYPVGGESVYDDFFLISGVLGHQSKLLSFTVWKIKKNNYISGLQFTYTNYNNEKIVLGHIMNSRSENYRAQNYISKTFTLSHDEYAIQLKGRKGMILDNFSILTSKGNLYSFGGIGGGEYFVNAPEGYHFTNFGGLYSEGWDSISSFSTDLASIPTTFSVKEVAIKQQNLLSSKPVFRRIVDFLLTSEVVKLFRVSKAIALLRFDEYIIELLCCRCLYSGKPNLITYMKLMVQFAPSGEGLNMMSAGDRVNQYFEISENKVENPHGEQSFNGFDITENGGDKIVVQQNDKETFFQCSFGWSTLRWKRSLTEIYPKEIKRIEANQQITSGNYAIVAGASIADSGFGVTAKIKLEVFDESNNIIFQVQKICEGITREYNFYCLKYIHINSAHSPHSFALSISGKDTCFWAGHYGTKIRNISFKTLPIETYNEKSCFEKFIV